MQEWIPITFPETKAVRNTSAFFVDKFTITIPVFNQLHYTKQCLDSLRQAGVPDEKIIVINNASSDGTAEYLASQPRIRAVKNESNIGCGPAWTQGAKLSQSEWTMVLNNDVLVPAGCIEGLLSFAREQQCSVVCPAMREGDLDYDWQAYAKGFVEKMGDIQRKNSGHGVCFMAHRSVFEKIGYFNDYGGYEDDDFFCRARHAGFHVATTGRAFLHHFGSITQKHTQYKILMTKEHRRRYREATGQTWLKRKINLLKHNFQKRSWIKFELRHGGTTLKEQRIDGVSRFR